MRTDEQWFAEYERVLDDYAAGDITLWVGAERLVALGMDTMDASRVLRQAKPAPRAPTKVRLDG